MGACPRCTGCTHHLELLNLTVKVESTGPVKTVHMHHGNTGASIFRALDANGEASVLKLHGIVTSMVSAGKVGQLLHLYRGKRYLSHEMLLARALTPMAEECGLDGVSMWERVVFLRAVVPLTGEKIEEQRAVLSEYALGASLEMLTLKLSSAQLLEALANIRHDSVRDAAIFDLLFVQGDRHSENLFIDGAGYFKLIDSRDGAIDEGLDSIFFATTWSHERNRVGNTHMYNRSVPAVSHHWPQTTLDYRCHVPGGALDKNYPPQARAVRLRSSCLPLTPLLRAQVQRCLSKWASMTPERFIDEYFSLAEEDSAALTRDTGANTVLLGARPKLKAERVIRQAQNMLEHGERICLFAVACRCAAQL